MEPEKLGHEEETEPNMFNIHFRILCYSKVLDEINDISG